VKIHQFACGVAAIALLGFGATSARANSRAGVGTTGPGSPSCTSFSFTVDGVDTPTPGAIPANTDCEESFNAGSIEVITAGDFLTNPLSLYSPLLQPLTVDDGGASGVAANLLLALSGVGVNLEWTQSCGEFDGSTTLEECTLTAPTLTPGDTAVLNLIAPGLLNDGDCDRDDDITFVPVNCDVFFTTGAIGNLGGDNGNFLIAGSSVTSNSSPVPEPGTVALLLVGMVGLFAFRRKYAL